MILRVTAGDASEDRLLRIIHTQNEIATSDLDLEAVAPPELLWHGTVERFLPAILAGRA